MLSAGLLLLHAEFGCAGFGRQFDRCLDTAREKPVLSAVEGTVPTRHERKPPFVAAFLWRRIEGRPWNWRAKPGRARLPIAGIAHKPNSHDEREFSCGSPSIHSDAARQMARDSWCAAD